MANKIFFSEWTATELTTKFRCRCECHSHPGTYPTTVEKPCHVCGHVHIEGYFPDEKGWVAYWRSDKAGTYGDS